MMAIAWWPPWTHSPSPVIPASVSTRTHRCMQWPVVAAVLTDVIFNVDFLRNRCELSWHCVFVVDRCGSVERSGPTVEMPLSLPHAALCNSTPCTDGLLAMGCLPSGSWFLRRSQWPKNAYSAVSPRSSPPTWSATPGSWARRGWHACVAERRRKELIDARIAEHHGRIVKLMGDGMLVEFPSVVDAVACAVEIQRGMAERNADVPADRRIEFRIGVNLGDVIVEGDDIYGDGVNVAARLEAIAEPGGIFVSSHGARSGRRASSRPFLRGSRRASAQEHRAADPRLSGRYGRRAIGSAQRSRADHWHCRTSRRSRCCRSPI